MPHSVVPARAGESGLTALLRIRKIAPDCAVCAHGHCGRPDRVRRMKTLQAPVPTRIADDGIATAFLSFVADESFPCVGAKAALARDAIETHAFERLGNRANDAPLLDALAAFARRIDIIPEQDTTVHSFVALFDGPTDMDERRFEAMLWSQLQRLHDLDAHRGTRWAEGIARGPDDPRFSLSLAGHPFFVIGLHPGASIRRRWCSTRTASSIACVRTVPTRRCRRRRGSVTWRCRDRSTRTWPISAARRKRASTAVARLKRTGAVLSMRGNRDEQRAGGRTHSAVFGPRG